MRFQIGYLSTLTLVAASLTSGMPGYAVAESHDFDAEHCVNIRSIDNTAVLSDTDILFYMRNGDIFLNRLPYRCAGLAVDETFMYRTSVGQICDADIITVLENYGFGFTPAASCGLGPFQPVSKETADELKSSVDETS